LPDPVRARALRGLREAFSRLNHGLAIDGKGYVADFRDVLLPLVQPEDFVEDLESGDGNELQTKFRACHSSSALVVKCFGPFRSRLGDLTLPGVAAFDGLQFERKCPTGMRGGRSPSLDLVLSGPTDVVAVESKLTEFLSNKRASFSVAYTRQIQDWRCSQGYFREMTRLIGAPDSYRHLDAAQLIKHAFGLAHSFRDRRVSLLYLYWEPSDPEGSAVFAQHRQEIERFGALVSGSVPAFAAMSYPELWSLWRKDAPDWLLSHLDQLAGRYLVQLQPKK